MHQNFFEETRGTLTPTENIIKKTRQEKSTNNREATREVQKQRKKQGTDQRDQGTNKEEKK